MICIIIADVMKVEDLIPALFSVKIVFTLLLKIHRQNLTNTHAFTNAELLYHNAFEEILRGDSC